jgi:glucose-6-phosphate 1-dehydrogenase
MPPSKELPLTIVVLGASGDLAKRKIYPALFALHCQGHLPPHCRIVGYARSDISREAFQQRITEHLTCRYVPGERCDEHMAAFLDTCYYQQGQYDNQDDYLDLYQFMHELEGTSEVNRIFYMAIPPSVFMQVAHALGHAGLVRCCSREPWSRAVIEKPFGHDRASSDEMVRDLGRVFNEAQTFRIDHYLGKEVIQDLMALRFANAVFQPLWNREHIRSVQISWMEEIGVEGRGGYFDHYGIIRDVMQNHLLQMLALTAMEQPTSFTSTGISAEKVKVLHQVKPLELGDIVVGQYTGTTLDGEKGTGYLDDDSIPADSITPTFAATVHHIDNDRWRGVPFLLRAGKAMGARMTEIRIAFKPVDAEPLQGYFGELDHNELVIRIQPDESIQLHVMNKVPGMGMRLGRTRLDLQYASTYDETIPEAYESLLLDVVRGNKELFIRKDELAAAWDVYTPVLQALADAKRAPAPYPMGSFGPAAADELAAHYGVNWEEPPDGKQD